MEVLRFLDLREVWYAGVQSRARGVSFRVFSAPPSFNPRQKMNFTDGAQYNHLNGTATEKQSSLYRTN